jgi:hypothetical protein
MTSSGTAQREQGLIVESLAPRHYGAVVDLSAVAWDRSRSGETAMWRYVQCPTLEGSVALHGGRCVACVFAMRRTYWSPGGDVEVLEPFDWFTTEEWRPRGAGLRVMRHLMSGPLPLVAMGGSADGQKLLARLGWKHLWTAKGLQLPLTGRYLASRGRSRIVARGFDLLGRPFHRPRRLRRGDLRVEPAATPGPRLEEIMRRQGRFGLVPRPNAAVLQWLRNAPAENGLYFGFNVLLQDEMVGWAWARVATSAGLRLGHFQDLLLSDEARHLYPAVVRKVASSLAGFGLDAVLAASSCPDTLAALAAARFRLDNVIPVYVWGDVPPGVALITGSHAEHAFFPGPTARDAVWTTSVPDPV